MRVKSKPVIALDFRWFDGLNMGCGQYRYSVDLIRDLDAPAPQDEIHAFPLPGCDEPPPG